MPCRVCGLRNSVGGIPYPTHALCWACHSLCKIRELLIEIPVDHPALATPLPKVVVTSQLSTLDPWEEAALLSVEQQQRARVRSHPYTESSPGPRSPPLNHASKGATGALPPPQPFTPRFPDDTQDYSICVVCMQFHHSCACKSQSTS